MSARTTQARERVCAAVRVSTPDLSAAIDVLIDAASERQEIVAHLYRLADEHFGPGHMHGEIVADIAGRIERGEHRPCERDGEGTAIGERIAAALIDKPMQFIDLHVSLGLDTHFRVVDRELQKLRRAGRIEYDKAKRVWRSRG
jgi:hypothetical protein